jgi:hypothetical protein
MQEDQLEWVYLWAPALLARASEGRWKLLQREELPSPLSIVLQKKVSFRHFD